MTDAQRAGRAPRFNAYIVHESDDLHSLQEFGGFVTKSMA
jgi:hypothetical protein